MQREKNDTVEIYVASEVEKESDVTTSIKIDGKYFFIELVEKKKPGDHKPVKLVNSEIITMLNMRHKSNFKEDLVKKLRSDFYLFHLVILFCE